MKSPPIIYLLTDDLLLRILSYLDDDSDRRSFRAVCRTFLGLDSLHRTSLRVLRIDLLPGLLQKCTGIESLDLSGCAAIDDAAVALLLRHGGEWIQRLKRLGLSRSMGLRSGGLEALMRACPRVEGIDVTYCCGFGDREVSALSCATGLKELRMDKCLRVTDVGLAKIAVGCGEKLEKLSLKWCLEITDIGIDLLVKKCPCLKELDVSYLKITNESLRRIGSLQKLEVLYMVGCGFVDDIGLSFLRNGCPLLQVLDVSRCDKVTSSGLMSALHENNGLRHVSASYCFFVSEFPIRNSLLLFSTLSRV